MEHRVGGTRHAFRPHFAGHRAEQGQQLGRATPDGLVRLTRRLPTRLPTLAWVRDGLVGAGLILAPERHCRLLGLPIRPVRLLDQPLFSSVRGSLTCTIPVLRLRWAVPVGHQVRVFWYELPAASSTRRMVVAPRCGKASRRRLRSQVLNDQVAVPSRRRSGGRWAVATIRARAAAS
jgi:hypothetical protein